MAIAHLSVSAQKVPAKSAIFSMRRFNMLSGIDSSVRAPGAVPMLALLPENWIILS